MPHPPTRRSVVRAGAWTVPAVTTAVAAPAHATTGGGAVITLQKTHIVPPVLQAGSQGTYHFIVANTGDVPVTDVHITDPMLGGTRIDVEPATLGPNTTGYASATYTITQPDFDSGKLSNTATVTATAPNNALVTDDAIDEIDFTPHFSASFTFDKSADRPTYDYGTWIWYSFTVTNTGNVTLTNFELEDDDIYEWRQIASSLAPGQSRTWNRPEPWEMSDWDVTRGYFTNYAEVTANPPAPLAQIMESDSVTVTYVPEPPENGA